MNYKEYLQSDHWHKKRKEVYKRDGYQCRLCDASNVVLNAHHIHYSNGKQKTILGNEPDYLLITLCQDCHSTWHKMKKFHKLRKGKVKNIRYLIQNGYSVKQAIKNCTPVNFKKHKKLIETSRATEVVGET